MHDARFSDLTRRDFLRWLGIGTGAAAASGALPLQLLAAADPDQNPARRIGRPATGRRSIATSTATTPRFAWVCAPNDTHDCRIRAYVRNGVIVRLGENYDYQTYADLYGNKATRQLEPAPVREGLHLPPHPLRAVSPASIRSCAAAGSAGPTTASPSSRRSCKTKYKFDSRGTDKFERIAWDDAFDYIAQGADGHRHALQRRGGREAAARRRATRRR